MSVVRQSQEGCVNPLLETEGLCESPHDAPAKWAAMIFGYFDESEDGGYFLVAGFIGKKKQWMDLIAQWKQTRGDRGPFHIKTMRLGGAKASSRHKKHLQDLGRIPAAVGLKPFYGYVRSRDLRKLVKGTIAAISLNGYSVALAGLIEVILESDIPKRDRIEFLFEQKSGVEVDVSRAFYEMERSPALKTHHGKSRIAKHSFIPKSLILEPSDYLAYACLQQLINKDSEKAALTSPILEAYSRPIDGKHLSLEQTQALLNHSFPNGVPSMDTAKKKYMKDRFKRDIEEKIGKTITLG